MTATQAQPASPARKRVDINAILAKPPYRRNCSHGAPMGRMDNYGSEPEKLYLQRVRFTDGCYSPDGTYWGSPANLWAAFSLAADSKNSEPVLIFCRAASRSEAARTILQQIADRLGSCKGWAVKGCGYVLWGSKPGHGCADGKAAPMLKLRAGTLQYCQRSIYHLGLDGWGSLTVCPKGIHPDDCA